MNFKIIPYDEIIKIYRKTHLFFPTHRETMGLVAQEIGMCGGLTVMQNGCIQNLHIMNSIIIYIVLNNQ